LTLTLFSSALYWKKHCYKKEKKIIILQPVHFGFECLEDFNRLYIPKTVLLGFVSRRRV